MSINKDLILKTIDIVNKIKPIDIIEIVREGLSRKYQLIYDELYKSYEFVCLPEKDDAWTDYYESLNELQEDFICMAVRGLFEDISISK
jgi:hypothetical protein